MHLASAQHVGAQQLNHINDIQVVGKRCYTVSSKVVLDLSTQCKLRCQQLVQCVHFCSLEGCAQA